MKSRLPLWGLSLLILTAVLIPGSLWAQAQGNFVYTNDDLFSGPNTVSGFSVASNGTLTPVPGSPFATGGTGLGGGFFASNRIGVTIVGNFLFASNSGSNDISAFTINPSTGVLTLVAGSPFPTGGVGGLGIAVSATPNGSFLMAANSFSGNITVFSIASNGALSHITGSPFPTLSIPDGIKVSPDGKFLAVAELNRVEMFSIASNGSLTSLGAFPGGGGGALTGVDIDCAASLLYGGEANAGNTIVDGYSIASNGTLTPVPGSPFVPFVPGVGSNSNVVLLSPNDKNLFVSNQDSNTITAFSVAPNGSLSLVPGSPFPMKGSVVIPSGMATSQDGTLLYVADTSSFFNPSGAISVFNVASNGSLTEVAGSPFLTGRPSVLLSLTAFPPKVCVVAFAAFSAKVDINVAASSFDTTGTFTLGSGGSINPLAQDVTIQVGSFTATIPAGSFMQNRPGFVFDGIINGVALEMIIKPQISTSFAFHFEAAGAVPATANPVTVGLTIGKNTGSVTVNADFQ